MATVETTNRNMPAEEYHAHPAIGSSMGKLFRESRREYEAAYITRTKLLRESSDCMDLGTVGHAGILEPHVIDDLIVEIKPEVLTSNGQRRGKAWNKFVAENPGKILFSASSIKTVRAMQKACYDHPIAGALLRSEGPTEDSLFIDCNRSGLSRKCRIDKHLKNYIVDLKTTVDVSPAGFGRTIANFDYEFSAAWYIDVCEQFTGQRKNFLWIAVSTVYPHPVRVYKLNPEAELTAWSSMDATLVNLAGCYDSGDWSDPGEFDVVELGLPVWKTKNQWEITQ